MLLGSASIRLSSVALACFRKTDPSITDRLSTDVSSAVSVVTETSAHSGRYRIRCCVRGASAAPEMRHPSPLQVAGGVADLVALQDRDNSRLHCDIQDLLHDPAPGMRLDFRGKRTLHLAFLVEGTRSRGDLALSKNFCEVVW